MREWDRAIRSLAMMQGDALYQARLVYQPEVLEQPKRGVSRVRRRGTIAAVAPLTKTDAANDSLHRFGTPRQELVMRFPKFAKATVAVLALAFVAPVMGGCAVPTGGDAPDGANVQTGSEALAVPAVTPLAAAQAAMALVGMFSTYEKNSDLIAKQEEILTNVKAMQTQLDTLNNAVNDMQGTIDTALLAQLDSTASDKSDVVEVMWNNYNNAVKNNATDPTALPRFLEEVRTNSASEGLLNIADLLSYDKFMRGTPTKPGMLKVLAQSEAKRGVAGAKDDALGIFMTSRTIVQAKAFFILREANRNSTSVDIAQMTKDHEERMLAQTTAFFEATELYNNLVLDGVAKERAKQVSACEYDPAQDNALTPIFGRLPLDAPYTNYIYKDNGQVVESVYPLRGCQANQFNYIQNVNQALKETTLKTQLLPVEAGYKAFREEVVLGKYLYTTNTGATRTVDVTRTGDGTLTWTELGNSQCKLTVTGNQWDIQLDRGASCWGLAPGAEYGTYVMARREYPSGRLQGISWGPTSTMYMPLGK